MLFVMVLHLTTLPWDTSRSLQALRAHPTFGGGLGKSVQN